MALPLSTTYTFGFPALVTIASCLSNWASTLSNLHLFRCVTLKTSLVRLTDLQSIILCQKKQQHTQQS